jgi:hypothetical protein
MVRIRGIGRIWGEARIYSIVDGAVTVCHELETHSGEIGRIHGHRWWPLERKEGKGLETEESHTSISNDTKYRTVLKWEYVKIINILLPSSPPCLTEFIQ